MQKILKNKWSKGLCGTSNDLKEVITIRIKPPQNMRVSDWADKNRKLSPESSAESGAWNTARAEYQRGILDCYNNPKIKRVVIMSSAQIGKTEIFNNIVGYTISINPRPVLFLQPTLEMAETWSKDRLAPMLRDTPCLHGKVSDPRSRTGNNTIKHKEFAGGRITMAGANSPASLASRPICKVFCDEVDRYPDSAGSEGDPVKLAEKRTTTYWDSQIWIASTPTIKGKSRIEKAYSQSDQRKYYVPCPKCQEYQVLMFEQVKWEKDIDDKTRESTHKPETAYYECKSCEYRLSDAERYRAVKKGYWKADIEFKDTAGFWINELYSPWVRLEDFVKNWLESKKDPLKLQTFINTSLGETFEDANNKIEHDLIQSRAEDWGDSMSNDIVIITCGVDVQKDRIEAEVVGWGIGYESWSLDYKILHGDTSDPHNKLWKDFDEYIRDFRVELHNGNSLAIRACAIDSGYNTEVVHKFCGDRKQRLVFAVKGSSNNQAPIASLPRKTRKSSLRIISVGGSEAKKNIYTFLENGESGGFGYCHFPRGRDETYYRGLTAEEYKIVRKAGGSSGYQWVTKYKRNEPLDCRIYAYAILKFLELPNDPQLLERLKKENEQKKIIKKEVKEIIDPKDKPFIALSRPNNNSTWSTQNSF
tara:strand:- start:9508 stop:11445 length:1938 start_codon:yes stop_codon:yes gene_type:complete